MTQEPYRSARRVFRVTDNGSLESRPEWLTIDEFREALRIGRWLAYALVNTGAVPARKFGRIWRVHRSALAVPIANQKLTNVSAREETRGHDGRPRRRKTLTKTHQT
jgi:hypothetical protein